MDFLALAVRVEKKIQSAKCAKIQIFQKSQKMSKKGQNLRFVVYILKVAHRHQNTPSVQFSAIYDNVWGFYADFCVSDFFKFSQLFWAPAQLLLIPTVTQMAVVWKVLNIGLQKFDNLFLDGMGRI